jgi:succinate-semialdehyde dehydrogenase/glutarate-semialdehyde dehydrogenase
VQAGVYDSFAAKLAERVKGMVVGDSSVGGSREGGVVTCGPLINAAAVRKVSTN